MLARLEDCFGRHNSVRTARPLAPGDTGQKDKGRPGAPLIHSTGRLVITNRAGCLAAVSQVPFGNGFTGRHGRLSVLACM